MIDRRMRLGLCILAISGSAALGQVGETTFLPSSSSPMVALRLVFDAGSARDPAGKEGLATLTAALTAQGGTKELTYAQVLDRFYPMSASLNSATRKEVTVFSGEIHRDNLNAYQEIIVSMITAPRFAKEDFERLRNESLDYVTKFLRGNNDEELGKWALQDALYSATYGGRHPYRHTDRGAATGLRAITLDDVKAFHAKYYTAARLHLGVAGGADQAFVEKLKASLAAKLPAGEKRSAAANNASPLLPKGLEITIVEKPCDSTAISIGFPYNLTRSSDDFYTLAVANSYLGEHRTFNGRLMQDLRGKRGLNYGDYSYIEDFIQDGIGTFKVPNNPRREQYFSIWVRPVPHDKAVFALRAALWELDRLASGGMSPADFDTTRSFLLNYSKLWVQTLPRRLGYKMDGAFYGRDDLVTELGKRLPTMTLDQVNDAVRRYFRFPGLRVAIVTKDGEALLKALTSGKPSPITYDTLGTPADVLAEDKVIEAFPLKVESVRRVSVSEMFEK